MIYLRSTFGSGVPPNHPLPSKFIWSVDYMNLIVSLNLFPECTYCQSAMSSRHIFSSAIFLCTKLKRKNHEDLWKQAKCKIRRNGFRPFFCGGKWDVHRLLGSSHFLGGTKASIRFIERRLDCEVASKRRRAPLVNGRLSFRCHSLTRAATRAGTILSTGSIG